MVAEEIIYVMKGLGHDLTHKDVTAIISEADVDGDGRLNYTGMRYHPVSYACSYTGHVHYSLMLSLIEYMLFMVPRLGKVVKFYSLWNLV